jgi:hypothetical protein
MDLLNEELIKFWKALNDHHVRYVKVGAFAVRFHGYNRSTDDLEIWLEESLENRKNLRKAFVALGYGDLPELESVQFVPGFTSFYIGSGVELDIMTEMLSLESSFQESLSIASEADFEGVKVPYLNLNQLIANKKMINRSKDQIDVLELENIRRIRESEKRPDGHA